VKDYTAAGILFGMLGGWLACSSIPERYLTRARKALGL
jgi:hypothetical protein